MPGCRSHDTRWGKNNKSIQSKGGPTWITHRHRHYSEDLFHQVRGNPWTRVRAKANNKQTMPGMPHAAHTTLLVDQCGYHCTRAQSYGIFVAWLSMRNSLNRQKKSSTAWSIEFTHTDTHTHTQKKTKEQTTTHAPLYLAAPAIEQLGVSRLPARQPCLLLPALPVPAIIVFLKDTKNMQSGSLRHRLTVHVLSFNTEHQVDDTIQHIFSRSTNCFETVVDNVTRPF